MASAFKNAIQRRRRRLSNLFGSKDGACISIKVVKGVSGFGMGFSRQCELETVVLGGPAEGAGARRLLGRRVVRVKGPRGPSLPCEDGLIEHLSQFCVGDVVVFVFEALPDDDAAAELFCTEGDEVPHEAGTVHSEREHRLEEDYRLALSQPSLCVGTSRHEGLRALAWRGVPEAYRAEVWRYLTKCSPFGSNASTPRSPASLSPPPDGSLENLLSSNGSFSSPKRIADYQRLVQQHWECMSSSEDHAEVRRQVELDVLRMQPGVPLFRSRVVQDACVRILYIWGIRHPASGYVQGMDAVLSPFLAVFFSEQLGTDVLELTAEQCSALLRRDAETEPLLLAAETHSYFTFSTLLGHVQHFYTPSQPGVQEVAHRVACIVEMMDPDLHAHIIDIGADYLRDFVWRWGTCFLARELPLQLAKRLWDSYLAEGAGCAELHTFVCARFLFYFRDAILEKDFASLMKFLRALPTADLTEDVVGRWVSEAYMLQERDKLHSIPRVTLAMS